MRYKVKEFLLSRTNLKELSKRTYRFVLNKFIDSIDNREEIIKQDVLDFFNTKYFKSLSIATQNIYKQSIRLFLKSLKKDYDYIKKKRTEDVKIRKEDLPTKREINKLLQNLDRTMDRCLVMIFLEGIRLNEARNIKLKDIIDKNTHMIIWIWESKSKRRPIPVVEPVPYIIDWLKDHPDPRNPDQYLFCHKWDGKMVKYSRRGLQRIICRNNCTKKRLYPHIFRHVAMTRDYGKLTEKEMMAKYGLKTRAVLDVYSHMDEQKDLEKRILQLHGIIEEEKEEEDIKIIKNKTCLRCGQLNAGTNHFCSRCGFVLDKESLKEYKEVAEQLEQEIKSKSLTKLIDNLIKKRIKEMTK